MILDLINKKRLGQELTYQELDSFFNGYLNGEVADYQMSAMLMAICINGMTDDEIFARRTPYRKYYSASQYPA